MIRASAAHLLRRLRLTPEQAAIVFDLLGALDAAIWEVYGDEITEVAQRQAAAEAIDDAATAPEVDLPPF